MITCRNCGNQNDTDIKICAYCGAALDVATTTFDDTDFQDGAPRWGSARFNSRTNLVIGVGDEVRTFTFDSDEIEELVVGREDPKTGDAPAINLSPHDGSGKGVSRKHAVIIRKDGSLYIVDKNSVNGTFLNGQKLVAEQARVLRDGDEIRFGHLSVRITFERSMDRSTPT